MRFHNGCFCSLFNTKQMFTPSTLGLQWAQRACSKKNRREIVRGKGAINSALYGLKQIM